MVAPSTKNNSIGLVIKLLCCRACLILIRWSCSCPIESVGASSSECNSCRRIALDRGIYLSSLAPIGHQFATEGQSWVWPSFIVNSPVP
ncbi:hypothetical protein TorRG33x02_117340 [Trema orientale]|uniref:Secreted protein n=1 Tax=Trema orientale TaxID=63057 RepID=A0A2P5F3M4_TREOI|nr:hypothetical protein TorRG33x02_117340 [Trema orientale]